RYFHVTGVQTCALPIYIIEPTVRFSAAAWAETANSVIAQIRQRGKMPIVVGGTGFYLRALLEPHSLAQVPPNARLRKTLEALDSSEERRVGCADRSETT